MVLLMVALCLVLINASPEYSDTQMASLAPLSKQEQSCNFDDKWACSNPWLASAAATFLTVGISNYWEDKFSMACVRHDGCYRHGKATYGFSRTECDDMFYEDMKKAVEESNIAIRPTGYMFAEAYYKAVQNFGDPHYHKNTSTYCLYDKKNENAHVHQVHSTGRLGDTDFRYQWSDGWNIVESYSAAASPDKTHVLLLKSSNGKIHLHKPHTEGNLGAKIADYDWASGYTSAKSFRLKNRSFILFYRYADGEIRLREIKADGKLYPTPSSNVVYSHPETNFRISDNLKLPEEYSSVEFYDINGEVYLFMLKGQPIQLQIPIQFTPMGNGKVSIFKVHQNRRIPVSDTAAFASGDAGLPHLTFIKEYDWSAGWSTAKFYKTKDANGVLQTYLMLLKTTSGLVHLHKMNTDGTVGQRIKNYDWSSGWSTAEFYEVEGTTYLMLLKKSNGRIHLHKMKTNGEVGELVRDYNWSSNWTSTNFYTCNNDKLCALMMKAYN